MKYLVFVLLLLGCGEIGDYFYKRKVVYYTPACTVTQGVNGDTIINCGKQEVIIPKATDGKNGVDGKDSKLDCITFPVEGGNKLTCSNGMEFVVKDGLKGDAGVDGESFACTSSPIPGGTQVACSNGDQFDILNGVDGIAGTSVSCSSEEILNGHQITCTDGVSYTVLNGAAGATGAAGDVGATGQTGADGTPGVSVVFTSLASTQCATGGTLLLFAYDTNHNNVLDTDDAGLSSLDVCNGTNGTDGTTTIVQVPIAASIIDPCGNHPGVYDEILLKLGDGTILASFSDNANGKNTRFSILGPGNYMVTDGSRCYFSINSSNNIFNEHY